MEAAPRTPTGFEDKAWALLSGTIKGAWKTSFREGATKEGVVAPGFSTGNTGESRKGRGKGVGGKGAGWVSES